MQVHNKYPLNMVGFVVFFFFPSLMEGDIRD